MAVETAVSLHVREIVAVLVLDHRFNHVKTVLVHVHLPAKAVAVQHVRQDVKVLVNHHVQEVAIQGARKVVIKDARVLATMAALDLVIQVVKKHVKMVAKELARVVVRGLVQEIVTLVVLPRAEAHVQGHVFMVVVGGVPTIFRCGRK